MAQLIDGKLISQQIKDELKRFYAIKLLESDDKIVEQMASVPDVSSEISSLEETFEQIETIIKQLESPEVTLDDSFRLYQAGVEKLKTCNLLLDTVEKKMQVMQTDGSLADFE